MRIFQLVLFIALICFSTVAGAQELESQSFKLNPWVFMDELPTSFSGATAVKRSYVVALMLNYQRAPLTLWRTDPWKVESHIIGHQVTGDLLVGYGVLEWFDVGLAIPLVLYQSGDGLPDADKPSTMGMGDIRILPRIRLYRGMVDLALIPQFVLPTGKLADPYMGRGGLQFIPTLAASKSWGDFSAGLNVYYRLVEDTAVAGLKLEDEVGVSLGASYQIRPKVTIFSEFFGRTLATEPLGDINQTPLEAQVGARYRLTSSFTLVGGLGAGITKGYTAPDYRIFAGIGWGEKGSLDPDKDGIFGDKDKCPNEPEDFDGFQDEDGCPDPDNDGDGIPDVKDKCPGTDKDVHDNFAKTREDKDGFQDEDGCPDPDNDGDGIPDTKDKCPGTDKDKKNNFKDTKENYNGFEDKDGCPEPDRDGDGIPDKKDNCPDQAEDKDNFDDEDGCPDPDNDEDGVPDVRDKCPGTDKDVTTDFVKTKEDKDGFEDEDGCPDPDNDGDGIPDKKDKCPGTDKDKKNNFKDTKENINGVKDFDGCPDKGRSLVQLTATKIQILQKVFFAYNRARIMRRSNNLLNQVAAILKTYPHIVLLEIGGHTDQAGKREKNLRLSQQRAEAVLKYLVKLGIKPARLKAVGYGPDNPVKSCNQIKNRRRRRTCNGDNRRVEFSIMKTTTPVKPPDSVTPVKAVKPRKVAKPVK